MARTQYIFIDYENVCETDLSRIDGKDARVYLIVGTHHKNLPTTLVLFAQDRPGQVRIIQTPVKGKNALDFVLTVELGARIKDDPDGYFHIISKDTDFESVIRHLKSSGLRIARHSGITEVPALRTTEERISRLRDELQDNCKNRPSTRKTLENRILSLFEKQVDADFVARTIDSFVKSGLLDFTDTGKVLYISAA
jgi:uncharacterized LabA/DUF88 family protein